jgi:DNA repair exonuclease SbcCD ATPase subunit
MASDEIQELEKYFNLKMDDLKVLLEVQMQTSEKALKIQAAEYERRLAALNHEAAQLKDMQSRYLPRETFDIKYQELRIKNDELQTFKDQMVGKASQSAVNISIIIAIVGFMLAIAGLVIR